MDLQKVSKQDWIVGGGALLLVIDLFLLPWFNVSAGPFSTDLSATDTPSGFLGVLAVIAALALLADVAIATFSPSTQLPAIGGSRGMTRFILADIAAAFILLKFLLHTSEPFASLSFGFFAAIVIAGVLVFFTFQARTSAS